MIKRFKILIFTCIFAVILISCGYTPDDYLTYQNFPIELDAVIKFGGERYDVFMSVTGIGEGSLIYKTPLTLTGYRYDVAGGEVTMSYERLIVKLTEDTSHPAESAVNMFTLTPENMISAELADHGGIKLNRLKYKHNGGTVTVWCTPDNIPVRIESDILTLDIINFRGNLYDK